MSIRIVIVEDHKIMIDGLRSLIERESDFEVINCVQDGRSAVECARKLKPDVMIMDIGLPGLNGIEATRQIIRDIENIKIIALSMHSEKKFIIEMLKAGASGYLLKDCAFDELISAIRTVSGGKNYLSPSITDTVIDNALREKEMKMPSAFSLLTDRERQVLQLLAEGRTTKQAAAELYISPKTVETHRAKIMEKLNMDNLAELTKYAVREGLTSLDK